MAEYLYSKNSDFIKYLERSYVSSTALSVNTISDFIILPNAGFKSLASSCLNETATYDKQINDEVIFIGEFYTQLKRIYALPNIIEYTCKCIGYWLKHNLKQMYIRIKQK